MKGLFVIAAFFGISLASLEAKEEERNIKSVNLWENGFIPDQRKLDNQNFCMKQCWNGGNWIINLPSERLQIIYDQKTATLAVIDIYREIAIVFTRNISSYFLINIRTGWSTIINMLTGFAIILPQPLPNLAILLGQVEADKYSYLQYLSLLIAKFIIQIPVSSLPIYVSSNAYDMNILMLIYENGNAWKVMVDDGWMKHVLKVPIYRKVSENIGDIPGVLLSLFGSTITSRAQINLLDILRALLNRAPLAIQNGFTNAMTILVGTDMGLVDSVQLYTQLFGLFSLLQGTKSGLITEISCRSDRAWRVLTKSGGVFFITSTGNIYQNGVIIDTLDDSQRGTINPNIEVTNSTFFNTNFQASAGNKGFVNTLGNIAAEFAGLFGFRGVVQPMTDFGTNLATGSIQFLNGILSQGAGFASNAIFTSQQYSASLDANVQASNTQYYVNMG